MNTPFTYGKIATDDKLMLKIAYDYIKLTGIENTQFIIARHLDHDHPHCLSSTTKWIMMGAR